MGYAANVEITEACNNRCVFCATDGHITHRSMPQIRHEILMAKEKGAIRLDLTGGDPSVHPQLMEIVSYASRLGFETIYFKTNGRRLSDLAFARELVRRGVNEFLISIHGHRSDVHDPQTSIPGSFQEAMQAVENLRILRVRYSTLSVINLHNYRYLAEIAQFMLDHGSRSHAFAFIYPVSRAYHNFAEIVPRYRDASPFLSKALEILVANGATSNVDNVPFCHLKGFERFHNHLATGGIMCHPPHEFGPACGLCLYRPICEGMPSAYVAARGWDEFEPLTSQLPSNHEPPHPVAMWDDQVCYMLGTYAEKPFGVVLVGRGIVPMTPLGSALLPALDGRTTLREIERRFGDTALGFIYTLWKRDFIHLDRQNAKDAPGLPTGTPCYRSKQEYNGPPLVAPPPGEYEYPLYHPHPPYPMVTLHSRGDKTSHV